MAPASGALLPSGVYIAPFRRHVGCALLVAIDGEGIARAEAEYTDGDELERERAHYFLEQMLEFHSPSPKPGPDAKVLPLRG